MVRCDFKGYTNAETAAETVAPRAGSGTLSSVNIDSIRERRVSICTLLVNTMLQDRITLSLEDRRKALLALEQISPPRLEQPSSEVDLTMPTSQSSQMEWVP